MARILLFIGFILVVISMQGCIKLYISDAISNTKYSKKVSTIFLDKKVKDNIQELKVADDNFLRSITQLLTNLKSAYPCVGDKEIDLIKEKVSIEQLYDNIEFSLDTYFAEHFSTNELEELYQFIEIPQLDQLIYMWNHDKESLFKVKQIEINGEWVIFKELRQFKRLVENGVLDKYINAGKQMLYYKEEAIEQYMNDLITTMNNEVTRAALQKGLKSEAACKDYNIK